MSKAKKIFIAVTVVLSLAVVALAVSLGIFVNKSNKGESKLNGIYEKSYHEAADSINDIELRLNKVKVLTGSTLRQELLNDIWRECDVASTNLTQLGTDNEQMETIIKFLNQLGDYCYFLSLKLKTSTISEDESENLNTFYGIVKEINTGLNEISDKLISGQKIDNSFLSDNVTVSDAIKNHSSVDYPELIYDGPFSDALNEREIKFLSGKAEITSEQGAAMVAQYFPDATNVEYVGEGTTSLSTYLYQFDIGEGKGAVQLTKIGGFVASYNAYSAIDDPTLTEEECIAAAEQFVAAMGYPDMKPVWISNNNSTVYINFAYVDDSDIVYYPDMIKVKINGGNGELLGIEAQNYLYNHVERDVDLTKEKTIILNKNLTVKSQTYCLIPTEWNTEVVCKEIVAEAEGVTYYIYFDLTTGEELKALVVIEDDGKLLA